MSVSKLSADQMFASKEIFYLNAQEVYELSQSRPFYGLKKSPCPFCNKLVIFSEKYTENQLPAEISMTCCLKIYMIAPFKMCHDYLDPGYFCKCLLLAKVAMFLCCYCIMFGKTVAQCNYTE